MLAPERGPNSELMFALTDTAQHHGLELVWRQAPDLLTALFWA